MIDLREPADKLLRAGLDVGIAVIAAWMIARGYSTGHGDTIEDLLAEIDDQARESALHESSECPVCKGAGTIPMATMALYIPPAERRVLDQTAADNPVTCWRCDGTGKKNL